MNPLIKTKTHKFVHALSPSCQVCEGPGIVSFLVSLAMAPMALVARVALLAELQNKLARVCLLLHVCWRVGVCVSARRGRCLHTLP